MRLCIFKNDLISKMSNQSNTAGCKVHPRRHYEFGKYPTTFCHDLYVRSIFFNEKKISPKNVIFMELQTKLLKHAVNK